MENKLQNNLEIKLYEILFIVSTFLVTFYTHMVIIQNNIVIILIKILEIDITDYYTVFVQLGIIALFYCKILFK